MNNSPSTTSRVWPTPWPIKPFAAGPAIVGFIIVAIVVGFGLWQGVLAASSPIDPNLLSNPTLVIDSLVITLVGEGTLVIIMLFVLPRAAGRSLGDLGYRLPGPGALGIAALGAIAMALVANGGSSLIQTFVHTQHDQETVLMVKHLHDSPALAAFAIFACVAAPAMEETIFRVFLFNATRSYAGIATGAVVSSICFALAHGDLLAALPLALAGLVLCFVYYRTRNAFASMITHGLFNALTFAVLIFFPKLAT